MATVGSLKKSGVARNKCDEKSAALGWAVARLLEQAARLFFFVTFFPTPSVRPLLSVTTHHNGGELPPLLRIGGVVDN